MGSSVHRHRHRLAFAIILLMLVVSVLWHLAPEHPLLEAVLLASLLRNRTPTVNRPAQ